MPTIIIKTEPGRDLYLAWSTVFEAPIAWGSRTEMLAWATADWRRRQGDATPEPVSDPAARLDRADVTGTSAAGDFSWFGAWDYDSFVYEQRGVLPRRSLSAAIDALSIDREDLVWDLLEPFDGETEVRRG